MQVSFLPLWLVKKLHQNKLILEYYSQMLLVIHNQLAQPAQSIHGKLYKISKNVNKTHQFLSSLTSLLQTKSNLWFFLFFSHNITKILFMMYHNVEKIGQLCLFNMHSCWCREDSRIPFNTKDKLFLVTRVYFRMCSTHFHAIGWKNYATPVIHFHRMSMRSITH